MPLIHPFTPYRFSQKAGRLEELVIPSSGTITAAARNRYLAINPNNVVRAFWKADPSVAHDGDQAFRHVRREFDSLISRGIVEQTSEPALFACFQDFSLPESGERLTRKVLIALADIEPYNENIYRHEQTFSERKADQHHFLQHARVQFDPILMLYSDPELAVERIVDQVARGTQPIAEVRDETAVVHRLYQIRDREQIGCLQAAIATKKLIIADGHHRYEAALAFRRANPSMPQAQRVSMAFTNVCDSSLRILATHRVVEGLNEFDINSFCATAAGQFGMGGLESLAQLRQLWATGCKDHARIGVVSRFSTAITVLTQERNRKSDVQILNEEIIHGILGIPTQTRDVGEFVRYVRGLDTAASMVHSGAAQVAFLLAPTPIEDVVSTVVRRGELMPQKSTDFFPKMLSGLLMHAFN